MIRSFALVNVYNLFILIPEHSRNALYQESLDHLFGVFEVRMFKDGVLAILASAIFIYFLYYTFKELSYRLASRKAGCSSPIRYWHWDPILGFDLLLRKIKDMNKGDSEATDREILKAYGKTVQTNNLGMGNT